MLRDGAILPFRAIRNKQLAGASGIAGGADRAFRGRGGGSVSLNRGAKKIDARDSIACRRIARSGHRSSGNSYNYAMR